MSNPEVFDNQPFFDAIVDDLVERVGSIDWELQEAKARWEAWLPPKGAVATETIDERLEDLRQKLISQKKRSFCEEVYYEEYDDDGLPDSYFGE